MKRIIWAVVLGVTGCTSGSPVAIDTRPRSTADSGTLGGVYDAFGANVDVYLDGGEVVFETNGWPDHPTPYWGPGHELYVQPTVTTTDQMSPGYIERFTGTFTLRVPAVPQLAVTSSATGLGAIGIAVSGAVIYNDQEGPNVPLDSAVGSLDYTGAHTGPQSYHYHLEPTAWSEDDDALIGVMADGFFLYGRREPSSQGGVYPTDLDESGGHVGVTLYSSEPVYHYHIPNETYLGRYYILFAGDYRGTPSAIR